ncbi:peptidase M15 [Streptomyces sp. HNM0575]|uniref:D-Ala-D-Ala carboxypeptidase family metallohydrolase n=1 Tax=Streptomyces sp. HNM0575 TaxID=2716338 RepID=UPI00145D67B5|nr:D-Ala-D-Ala carboxypeptidase family metallohydrolase [Streptomyces sp. HNM0575]NLU72026.1 peptidase M15 [Streptomyces sp. HNM0575]
MPRRAVRAVLALVMVAAAVLVGTAAVATAGPAAPKDGCFTWSHDLAEGASGDDVKQLQIRVSGYPASGEVIAVDGEFGPATKAAVARFQKAYGLSETGKGDSATYNKIYELQDDDCSPAHFAFGELNNCNSDWSGGAVSAAEAKSNALRTMWKLEAMRHAMGDKPLRVTSGFRSKACNDQVGGAASSRHLFGDAADLGAGSHSLCEMAKEARNRGFHGILGPGFPGHDDHTHVDHRSSKYWDAPDCGVTN